MALARPKYAPELVLPEERQKKLDEYKGVVKRVTGKKEPGWRRRSSALNSSSSESSGEEKDDVYVRKDAEAPPTVKFCKCRRPRMDALHSHRCLTCMDLVVYKEKSSYRSAFPGKMYGGRSIGGTNIRTLRKIRCKMPFGTHPQRPFYEGDNFCNCSGQSTWIRSKGKEEDSELGRLEQNLWLAVNSEIQEGHWAKEYDWDTGRMKSRYLPSSIELIVPEVDRSPCRDEFLCLVRHYAPYLLEIFEPLLESDHKKLPAGSPTEDDESQAKRTSAAAKESNDGGAAEPASAPAPSSGAGSA